MATKAALADRLEIAIGMLTEIAEHPRLPKAKKEEIAAFAEEVRSGFAESAPGAGSIFRVATVINPATGKPATVPVKADGSHSARFAHMEPASEWMIVRAGSWAEATSKARDGEGEKIEAAPKAPKKPRKRSRAKGKASNAEAPSEVEVEA
jgi:hypothetical protein